MKDLPLSAIGPERAKEITQAAVKMLTQLLVTKSQAKAQKIAQDFMNQLPELAVVAELRTAFAAAFASGVTQTAVDESTPLTAQEFLGLLQRSGLSQVQLGEVLGAPQPHISGWLNGSRPIPQARAGAIRQACITAQAIQMLASATTVFDSPAGPPTGHRTPRQR